jgi:hypothetical protein
MKEKSLYLAEFLANVGLQGQVLLPLRYELLLKVLHQIQQDVILQLSVLLITLYHSTEYQETLGKLALLRPLKKPAKATGGKWWPSHDARDAME